MKHLRPTLGLLVIALLALAPAVAWGDAKLSKKQRQLNEQGVKAMIDGDFEKAVEIFQQSLDLGELNVTYLNLGRAYAKLGRCDEALNHYDRMAVAPRVDAPPPEQLYEILVNYRAELARECPGRVILRCSPQQMLVAIDGAEPVPCPSRAIELGAGERHIVGILGEQQVERRTEVIGMATGYVDLVIEDGRESAALFAIGTPPPTTASGGASVLGSLGWAALGTGTGLLLSMVLYDTLVLGDQVDRFNRAVARFDAETALALRDGIESGQRVNLVLLISGASLMATGTTLLILDLVLGDGDAPVQPVAAIDAQGAFLGLRTTF